MDNTLILANVSDEEFNNDMTLRNAVLSSMAQNMNCAELIDKAINENYDGFSLNVNNVFEKVLSQYSLERMAYVLAVRIYDNDGFDKRISNDNEKWAKSLLENVPQMYKDKGSSNRFYRDLNSYLSYHNGLVDMIISDFKKMFPDLMLEEREEPITSCLKSKVNGPLTYNGKGYYTDLDEFLDEAYLCFEMEYPSNSVAFEFMSRGSLGNARTMMDILQPKNTGARNCFVDVYESGKLLLIVSGASVPLSIEEEKALEKVLDNYTKARFHKPLILTVNEAIDGKKPPITINLESNINVER